jgi:hypothetical protein
LDIPGEPAPSLHPHPSKQELLHYYGPVRRRTPRPVLNAYGFCLGTLPLATFGAYDPGRQFRRSPSHVPCKSRRPGSRRLYAGHHLASNTGSRQAHPEDKSAPRFRCHLNRFRRLKRRRPTRAPSPDRTILERLPDPHLTRSSLAFSPDAHHDGLQPTQLQGGLTPAPAGPAPEGQQSSISRTAPHMKRVRLF